PAIVAPALEYIVSPSLHWPWKLRAPVWRPTVIRFCRALQSKLSRPALRNVAALEASFVGSIRSQGHRDSFAPSPRQFPNFGPTASSSNNWQTVDRPERTLLSSYANMNRH